MSNRLGDEKPRRFVKKRLTPAIHTLAGGIQNVRAGYPAAPGDTFLPLLPFGPDGIRRAPPRRTHPDGGEDTRCTGGCQQHFIFRINPIQSVKNLPQMPTVDFLYGREFINPVINCCFSALVSRASGCIIRYWKGGISPESMACAISPALR